MASPEFTSRLIAQLAGGNEANILFDVIQTPTLAQEYVSEKIWSWEPDLSPDSEQLPVVLNEGLDRKPIGFLPIGLRINGEITGITIFKRYSPEYLQNFPLLVSNGNIRHLNTILTLKTVADITQQEYVIELADTHMKKNSDGSLGLYTPLRHGKSILQKYLSIVRYIKTNFSNDRIMAVPMGVFPWTATSELAITNDIRKKGGELTVGEYIDRYNVGEHHIDSAEKRIGKVRGLSKMSKWLVEKAGFDFETVGYSPGDFGWICLTRS